MSIFAKGDFKIENSWGNRPTSKDSGKSANRPASGKRPTSGRRPESRENTSLMNVAQRILEPTPDILDKYVADKVYKDFQSEIPPPSSSKSEKKI